VVEQETVNEGRWYPVRTVKALSAGEEPIKYVLIFYLASADICRRNNYPLPQNKDLASLNTAKR
jgi:hypothetical protein